MISKRFSKQDFGPLSVDRWQSKIALSVDRAVDRHAPKCMCALRLTVRSTDCKSIALGWVRSTGPVDQQRVSLSGWEQRSIVQSTAIPNGQKSDR